MKERRLLHFAMRVVTWAAAKPAGQSSGRHISRVGVLCIVIVSTMTIGSVAGVWAQPAVTRSEPSSQTGDPLKNYTVGARSPVPAIGTPSLSVDQQIHLGLETSFFRAGKVFLWEDGSNMGLGYRTLGSNSSGSGNTGLGVEALYYNSTGSRNTGVGDLALYYNETGMDNTAVGFFALAGSYDNGAGGYNTALGSQAMYSNFGSRNTAIGYKSLFGNSSGIRNTAAGGKALHNNSTGSRNIAVGYRAGYLVEGNDNIHIGDAGLPADAGTIRLGSSGTQTATFIAGVYGEPSGGGLGGLTVYVNSSGRLGTANSSRRVKKGIRDMGEISSRLLDLRPVTFRFTKAFEQGRRPLQFGLIAEQVAESFPELVVYDSEGRPLTVRYHFLSSLLLNELQRQHRRLQIQGWSIAVMLIAGMAVVAGRWRFRIGFPRHSNRKVWLRGRMRSDCAQRRRREGSDG